MENCMHSSCFGLCSPLANLVAKDGLYLFGSEGVFLGGTLGLMVDWLPSLVVPWFVGFRYTIDVNKLTKHETVVRHMVGDCRTSTIATH